MQFFMSKGNDVIRRFIALFLCAAIIVGVMPESVYAAKKKDDGPVTADYECGDILFTYTEASSWGNTVKAEIKVTNNGSEPLYNWNAFLMYDGMIDNIWNADIVTDDTASGGVIHISPVQHNAVVKSGRSTSFGFIAHGNDNKPSLPSGITLEDDNDELGGGGDAGNAPDNGDSEEIIMGETEQSELVFPDELNALSYTVLSGSDEKNLSISASYFEVGGSIHTNKGFKYSGSTIKVTEDISASGKIKINTSSKDGSRQIGSIHEDQAYVGIPDICGRVYEYARESGEYYEDSKKYNSSAVAISGALVSDGSIKFSSSSFLGKGIIYAKENVSYSVGSAATPDTSRLLIVSENGDINISGSDINLNAVLYAPNGTVNINTSSLNLSGRIIAKNIHMSGSRLIINPGPFDYEMVEFLYKPELSIETYGNLKENRLVSLDISELTKTRYLENSQIEWKIRNAATDSEGQVICNECIMAEDRSNSIHKEAIFTSAGTYLVEAVVTKRGQVSTVAKEIVIEKDIEPLASFDMSDSFLLRDAERKASLTVTDKSVSLDDDVLAHRKWYVYFDSDDDGDFDDEEPRLISDGNDTEVNITADHVGRYRVFLEVTEDFTDTIKELIGADAYRKADTGDMGIESSVFEVGNREPRASVNLTKGRKADLVFTVGDCTADELDGYNSKAQEIEKRLEDEGIDVRIETVSTMYLNAQSSFAWEEFDHINFKDRYVKDYPKHIQYDGDDIQMIGYGYSAFKDFLYVACDDPGKKTFEFDIQRSREDWHSIEGGGFLFNTTIDESKNTIRGFAVLVTSAGLKLVQIDCNKLNDFRNGKYNLVQQAGKLLRTFPMTDLYANHHLKIVVDRKAVSVWDDDVLKIDDFVLPDMDSGYGYGPITSHVSHGCRQQSWFTFKNISMVSMTGTSLSDIIEGYDWRSDASRYVFNLSGASVPELSSDEELAACAAVMIGRGITFAGLGNENNEGQYRELINAIDGRGYYLPKEDLASVMDDIGLRITAEVTSRDYSVADFITKDVTIDYEGYYFDEEGDDIYAQKWEYEYDPSIFETGEGRERVLIESDEPIKQFDDTGAYTIRLRIQDDPASEKAELDVETGETEGTGEESGTETGTESEETLPAGGPGEDTTYSDPGTEEGDNPGTEAGDILLDDTQDYENPADSQDGILPDEIDDGEAAEPADVGEDDSDADAGTADLINEDTAAVPEDNESDDEIIIAGDGSDDDESFSGYRRWSETAESEKLLIVHTRPAASISASLTLLPDSGEGDGDYCSVNMAYDAYDEDHPSDRRRGIREEKFFYKNIKSGEWTEGRMPGRVKAGETYLAMYQVTDIEGEASFPAVCVIRTDEYRQYKEIEDTTPPNILLTASKYDLSVGEEIMIDGFAEDDYGVDAFNVYIGDKKILDCFGRCSYTPDEKGEVVVRAEATDVGGNKSETSITLTVTGGYDTTAPTAIISYPSDEIPADIDAIEITGTVKDDEKLKGYTLGYKNEGEEEYHIFAEGKEPVEEGTLGVLDLTQLKDGNYTVLLEAEDEAGNKSYSSFGIYGVSHSPAYTISAAITGIVLDKENRLIEVKGTVGAEGHFAGYELVSYFEGTGEEKTEAQGNEEISDDIIASISLQGLRNGVYNLVLRAYDDQGNEAATTGSFTYTAGNAANGETLLNSDVNPPYASIDSVALTENNAYIEIKATARDDMSLKEWRLETADGDDSEQWAVIASGNEAIENERVAQIETGSLTAGKHSLRLTAVDEFGNRCTSSTEFTYDKGKGILSTDGKDNEYGADRMFAVTLSRTTVKTGAEVTAFITLEAGMDEEELYVYLNDVLLEKGNRKVRFSPSLIGENVVTAYISSEEISQSTDRAGLRQASASCFVYDSEDGSYPEINIITPLEGSTVSEPSDVTADISDKEGLISYRAEYRAVKKGSDYVLLSEGTEPVSRGKVGCLDTTILADGIYEIRITATDIGGHVATKTREVKVEAGLKAGAMNIGFTDISNKLSGTTVNVNRMYSTLNKDSQGDFGYGWTMSMQGLTLTESSDMAVGYNMDRSGSIFTTAYTISETVSHDVILNYGDGTSDRFRVTFTPEKQALIPITETRLGFKCVTNPRLKLELIADSTAYVSSAGLTFYDDAIYGTRGYILTSEDDTKYYINARTGLYRIKDADGDVITVDKDGYHSDKGKSISFKRDEKGRVISATDIYGKSTGYTYDNEGNLISVTDGAGNTVSYTYDSRHALTGIIDPMGVSVARNEYDDEGRLVAVTDADGNRIEYDYDIEGRTQAVRDRRGYTTVYTYDDNGNILKTVDPLNNATYQTYDANNNVLSKTDALGNTTYYQYDDEQNLVGMTDALGNSVSSTYNSMNLVTCMKNSDGDKVLLEYTAKGKLRQTTDNAGNETYYAYSDDGNLSSISDELGQMASYTYDSDGNPISKTDADGIETRYVYDDNDRCIRAEYTRTVGGVPVTSAVTYVYDENGNICQTQDESGAITRSVHDANGHVTETVDPDGISTHYSYDQRGNLTTISYHDGTTESFSYDEEDNLISRRNRLGQTVTNNYDGAGNLVRSTDELGNATRYAYDPAGRVVKTVSPTGAVTEYEYDALGRNTAIITNGIRVSYTYNSMGKASSMTDGNGNTTQYGYDKLGNRTLIELPDGSKIKTEYDARGRIASQTDALGNKTKYEYDGNGNLIRLTDEDRNVTSYTYDEGGSLTSVTDAAGRVTVYSYDAAGQLTGITRPDGESLNNSYDSTGRLISSKDYAGNVISYKYQDGLLTEKETGDGKTAFSYDALNRLISQTGADGTISYTYDEYGRISGKETAAGVSIRYSYDSLSRLAGVEAAGEKTEYSYDSLNRLASVKTKDKAVEYGYDNNGNKAFQVNGKESIRYEYDSCNRLIREVFSYDGSAVAIYEYTYNAAGQKLKAKETSVGKEAESVYKYDDLNRLISEKHTEESADGKTEKKISYEYDKTGNRTEKEEDGVKTKYSYNELDQLISEVTSGITTAYEYDNNGSLVLKSSGSLSEAFAYSADNMLISYKRIEGVNVYEESYTYDAAGDRLTKETPEGKTIYVTDDYTGYSQVLLELDADKQIRRAYTRGGDLISATGIRGSTREIYNYISDGHGDVRYLTDGEGHIKDSYSYTAYGELISHKGSSDNPYLYCGESYDEGSGLYYLRARYMNPDTGSFISMDSYQGNAYDPASLHKYTYAQ
nr:cellulose binding domain-containing protein [Lachnospiraceae bacterium]